MLGSSAIPPCFPAVEIDGEYYWDGGIYSNTPVEVVFDEDPRRSCVVFAVQIWHWRGPESKISRACFHAREGHSVRQPHQRHDRPASRAAPDAAGRARTRRHASRGTEEFAAQFKELAGRGCGTTIHLVEINAQPLPGETNARDYDFSRRAIEARWQAGYDDTKRMIARQPWTDPIDPVTNVTVYEIGRARLVRSR